MSELANLIVDGLAALGDHEQLVAGGIIAYHAGETGIKLVGSAVRTLLPVLERKYAGTSPRAREVAAQNMLATANRIKVTIDDYVAAGRLTPEQGAAALDDPAFAVLFNDRLLEASETIDPLMQDAFAKMVVERMTKTSGSAEAILIGMASARLKELGGRQLRLIGAIFTAEYVYIDPFETRGSPEADFAYYTEQCEIEVRPFWDVPVLAQDIDHLDATNLIELSDQHIHRRFGAGRQSMMLIRAMQGYPNLFDPLAPGPEVFRKLSSWMEAQDRTAFKYIALKNPGWIIGAVVHSHFRDIPLDLGRFE